MLYIESINLFHSRLSIIDLKKRSNQPYEFKNYIFMITESQVLNYEQAKSCFEFIMSGNASDILISSFLTSLKINLLVNGFSPEIIAAGADIMREKAVKIDDNSENQLKSALDEFLKTFSE